MNNLARYHAEHLPDLMDRITKNSIGMDDYLNAFFNFDNADNVKISISTIDLPGIL